MSYFFSDVFAGATGIATGFGITRFVGAEGFSPSRSWRPGLAASAFPASIVLIRFSVIGFPDSFWIVPLYYSIRARIQVRLPAQIAALASRDGLEGPPFAVVSLRGKFRGPYARRATLAHIQPLPSVVITNLFSRTAL